jgi:O-methyltransferase
MTPTFEKRFTAFQKQIASIVFPRNVPFLEKLSANALIKRWIREHPDLPAFPHRFDLYDFIAREVIAEGAIDYLEFGVWKGESLIRWTELNAHPESRFWGFDSFEGLPEDWSGVCPAGSFDLGGKAPTIADPRVRLVKGWFHNTLPGFLKTFQPRSRLVINHDSDLYTSVMYCLTMTDRVMVPGTVVMFDEFSSPLHEFRAFQDYTHSYQRTMRPIAITKLFAQQAAFLME